MFAYNEKCAGIAVALVCAALSPATASAADVSWKGGVTAVYQSANDDQSEAELTASADLIATLASDSGEWLLYIEASSSPRTNGVSALYPTANGDARSVLTTDGEGSIQVSELNYTFRFGDQRSLMVGLIDPSAWLDRGRIANDENRHFLNGSFVNNATIEFPDYTLGAIFRTAGSGRRPGITLLVASSDGIAEVPDRSYQNLLDLTSDGRGVFIGAGTRWLFDRTSYRLGAWARTDDHAIGDAPDDTDMNYGAYGVFGWHSGPHALNLRAGLANRDVSAAEGFVALAYQRETRLGTLGAGIAHTDVASGFGETTGNRALDSELYLRIPVLQGSGHVTPSLQYLESPAVSHSEAISISSTVIASLRFRWSF